jgi:hypothetical protein
MEKLVMLRNKHGPAFFKACDLLHSGVTNPAAYLLAILEPESIATELTRRLQELALERTGKSGQDLETTHA